MSATLPSIFCACGMWAFIGRCIMSSECFWIAVRLEAAFPILNSKYNPSTPSRGVLSIPTHHLSSHHHSALNTAKRDTCKESQYFVFAWEKMNPWAMDIKKRMNRCLLKLGGIWKIRFHSSQLCSVRWIPDLSISMMQIIPPCISTMLN